MNVLLIGIDYFPVRSSSDKNFWQNALSLLSEKVGQITVISFNYGKTTVAVQPAAGRSIRIYNVRPSHLGIDLRPDPAAIHDHEKCHSHFKSPPRSTIEYLLSFLRIRPLIRHVINEQHITNVHCMDNFGPSLRLLLRWVQPIPLSVSAMGYYARGPLHDSYLRLSYTGLDAVVPFSAAYRNKLLELGLSAQRVHTIPWGINDKALGAAATPAERAELKRVCGIDPERRMVLWTGFIQQIRERELYTSLQAARKLASERDDTDFVFALKPECYRLSYQSLAGTHICLLPTSNATFLHLLRAADYLLSPIVGTGSIVTPPLAWIEAMAVGVPIVTNRVPGVEAVIAPGINGFVAQTVDAVPAQLAVALSSPNREEIGAAAREHILANYTVSRAAAAYEILWEELRNG